MGTPGGQNDPFTGTADDRDWFSALFNALPAGAARFDRDGSLIAMNALFEGMFFAGSAVPAAGQHPLLTGLIPVSPDSMDRVNAGETVRFTIGSVTVGKCA
jgi:PAS domain-containing protein